MVGVLGVCEVSELSPKHNKQEFQGDALFRKVERLCADSLKKVCNVTQIVKSIICICIGAFADIILVH
jgi:hypothetical protein